jgi:hypothetical protein
VPARRTRTRAEEALCAGVTAAQQRSGAFAPPTRRIARAAALLPLGRRR